MREVEVELSFLSSPRCFRQSLELLQRGPQLSPITEGYIRVHRAGVLVVVPQKTKARRRSDGGEGRKGS